MRSLRIAAVVLGLLAPAAFASPTNPQPGVEYLVLQTPQPVQPAGKKVEVIEFFMYHCPHCNALEPQLEQWAKAHAASVNFRRIHFPSTGPNDPEAHMHLTLEAMGKADEMQPKVFKAWHVDRIRLNNDEAILNWVAQNGIDRNQFLGVWNSFGVTSKLRNAQRLVDNYGVQFAPTIVVDGKYQTSPSQLGQTMQGATEPQLFQATLQTVDALVAKAAKSN